MRGRILKVLESDNFGELRCNQKGLVIGIARVLHAMERNVHKTVNININVNV